MKRDASGWSIRRVERDRKRYLSLLLEADPVEAMIDRYLAHGDMFLMVDKGAPEEDVPADAVLAVAVVARIGERECELKNIAVREDARGRGLGSGLVEWLGAHYAPDCDAMLVGTAGTGVDFYRKCGFAPSHVVKNFFVDNYPEPVVDSGVTCVDMVYLRREFEGGASRQA